MNQRWNVFMCSVFFVLGFSSLFSLAGVLLQTVFLGVSFTAQMWMARIGGILIIIFGLYLLGLVEIGFLQQERKLNVKRYRSQYLTSFLFGAAFAVGWSPCIGPVLGAILTLAVTQPSYGFLLMFAYSLGLGLPFLLVGLFTQQAKGLIRSAGKWMDYARKFFGVVLIAMGVLVFTNKLSFLANISFISDLLVGLGLESVSFGGALNIGIAFLAGIVSFLSPCVLPLIPAFLTYLASVVADE
jgi:cytochrome c-type biogenesis protein